MTVKTNTQTTGQTVDNGQLTQDLKNAILIVSLVANLFIFTTWVALQVTSRYDGQLAGFLFNN